jgi:hypothetical protein
VEADVFMRHSSLYPPLLSSESADDDELVSMGLAEVESAPAIGTLCGSVAQAMEAGSVVTAAAVPIFTSPPESPPLYLEHDEGVDWTSAASSVACATVRGRLCGSSSPLPFDSFTAGIYGRDVRINDQHKPPVQDNECRSMMMDA